MKKLLSLLTGLFLVVLVAGNASAVLYTDVYDAGPKGPVGLHMSTGWDGYTSHTLTFDITNHGFDPLTQEVTSASVKLHFSDYDNDRWFEEYATFNIGTNAFTWEVDTGWGELLTLNSFVSLNETGTVDATITATKGNFWFNKAVLYAEGTYSAPIGAPVPEPATMVLVGLGLLGLAGVSRKKSLI